MLYDKLIRGIAGATGVVRHVMQLQRELAAGNDDLTGLQLDLAQDHIECYSIQLLDELEIDFDTAEWRVNGGPWHCAIAADYAGVDINYPVTVALTAEELGSLYPLICNLRSECGVAVTATRIVYD